jgi:Trk K+ transport system NAD-binding subunit
MTLFSKEFNLKSVGAVLVSALVLLVSSCTEVNDKLGVNIIAVESGGRINVSPSADYLVKTGDVMVVLGDNKALEAVQKL